MTLLSAPLCIGCDQRVGNCVVVSAACRSWLGLGGYRDRMFKFRSTNLALGFRVLDSRYVFLGDYRPKGVKSRCLGAEPNTQTQQTPSFNTREKKRINHLRH